MLPARDYYWLFHDVEKYGVLVFDCQERAEQFLLTLGKVLPVFRPVKVSPTTLLEEARRAGAFAGAEGPLWVIV